MGPNEKGTTIYKPKIKEFKKTLELGVFAWTLKKEKN